MKDVMLSFITGLFTSQALGKFKEEEKNNTNKVKD